MIDERVFIQNQYEKIHSLDCEKYPINYFFYSNGVHFLCIKKGRSKYLLCGCNCGFAPLYRQSNLDVYFESDVLTDCVKQFERFIGLLVFPFKFEDIKDELKNPVTPEFDFEVLPHNGEFSNVLH